MASDTKNISIHTEMLRANEAGRPQATFTAQRPSHMWLDADIVGQVTITHEPEENHPADPRTNPPWKVRVVRQIPHHTIGPREYRSAFSDAVRDVLEYLGNAIEDDWLDLFEAEQAAVDAMLDGPHKINLSMY